MQRHRLALSIALSIAAAACSTTQGPQSAVTSSPAAASTATSADHAAPGGRKSAAANPQASNEPLRDERARALGKEEDKKDVSGTIATGQPLESEAALTAAVDGPAPASAPAKAAAGGIANNLDRVDVAGARLKSVMAPPPPVVMQAAPASPQWNPTQAVSAGEKYAAHDDNPVQRTADNPVSTFSIDVDTGSYSNVRRMLNEGQHPPADAVRAEEMINYFDYAYPAPISRAVPFRVTTEMAPAPWNPKHTLLQIGIKGYEVPRAEIPPANLVFLIDTSGSMDEPNKLPLLKQAFAQLVPNLRAQDRVAIVVYAGSAGLVLPTTPGDHHAEILAALDRLEAGGSTNGGAGHGLA